MPALFDGIPKQSFGMDAMICFLALIWDLAGCALLRDVLQPYFLLILLSAVALVAGDTISNVYLTDGKNRHITVLVVNSLLSGKLKRADSKFYTTRQMG